MKSKLNLVMTDASGRSALVSLQLPDDWVAFELPGDYAKEFRPTAFNEIEIGRSDGSSFRYIAPMGPSTFWARLRYAFGGNR